MQIIRRQQRQIEVDMFAVVRLMWAKKWQIILSGASVALLFLLFTLTFIKPLYTASVTLYANNSISTDISTSITTQDLSASVKLVDTYAAIILSDPVLDQVIQQNRLEISAKELVGSIKIKSVNETEVFRVNVKHSSPEMAASIANSIADIAPGKIGNIVDGCSVKIVNNAKVPVEKSYPSNRKAALLGFVIGLALSMGIYIIKALLDTRIKDELDLKEWDYPILGVIPSFSDAEKIGAYSYGYRKGVQK